MCQMLTAVWLFLSFSLFSVGSIVREDGRVFAQLIELNWIELTSCAFAVSLLAMSHWGLWAEWDIEWDTHHQVKWQEKNNFARRSEKMTGKHFLSPLCVDHPSGLWLIRCQIPGTWSSPPVLFSLLSFWQKKNGKCRSHFVPGDKFNYCWSHKGQDLLTDWLPLGSHDYSIPAV